MKMTLVPQQYFDGDGRPLVGRLSVFDRSTDVPGTEVSGKYTKLYTFADGEYSEAANPLLLDSEGRLPSSVYFDAAVVSVKLERYTGDSSMGSDDDPAHWETVDTYDTGMEWDDAQPTSVVGTVEELKDVPVASSPVLVLGYYRAGDCPARTYLWDGEAIGSPDDGYLVKSSASSSGRWVMLWGCDTLPCTLYGVFPGRTDFPDYAGGKFDNLNALFAYPEAVGTAQIATARKIRFLDGDYDTGALDYLTGKVLCFDRLARFTGTGVVKCPDVEVMPGGTSYVADFVFTDVNRTAHSAWFRTMDGFFGCKARKFVIQGGHFHDSGRKLSGRKLLEYVEIDAQTVLSGNYPAMYDGGAYLELNQCTIAGTMFGPEDFVLFRGMTFERTWFKPDMRYPTFRFGRISDGARIQALSSDGNVLDIFRFVSADVYLKAIVADGQTSVVLCGKTATALPDEIVAASGGTLGIVARDSGMLALSDMNVSTVAVSGCTLSLDRVRIYGGKVSKSSISARSCSFGCEISDQSENEGYEGSCPVTAYDSYFSAPVGAENIALDGCKVSGKVSVRSFLDTENRNTYAVSFTRCDFMDDGMVEFLPPQNEGFQVEVATVTFSGCRFSGTSAEGITMPRFVYRGNEYGAGAVKLCSDSAKISYEYRDTGNLSFSDTITQNNQWFKIMYARVFFLGAGNLKEITRPGPNPAIYSRYDAENDLHHRTYGIIFGEAETTSWANDQFYGRLEILLDGEKETGNYYGQKLY